MMSSIFPRHIIEFISVNGLNMVPESMGDLARSHSDVSILFMDIVGEWGGRHTCVWGERWWAREH